MNCSHPIDAGVFADYWTSALPEAEEESIELHLFECDECAARLDKVIAIAEGIRSLAREGSLRMIVSESFVRGAVAEGLRVREYAVEAGGTVQCTVMAEDDILIAKLAAELSGSKRVDLSICDGLGREQMRMVDIPVAAGVGEVFYQESIPYAKAMPSSKMIARLIGIDESGSELQIGEYTFEHTRSMPGPAAW